MRRGTLRIYLGAAPGVGKTFAMLNEGWRRRERGTDVVVGFMETHGRPLTAAQVRDLEVVPRLEVEHRGAVFSEIDLDAILARHPAVALVDELPHTNIPGSRNAKRWGDVDELLDAGIDVVSCINIQHLDSLNDVVEGITGICQPETVPDAFVRGADQIELVDMAPEALRRRMAHGNVYPADRVDAAMANYFRAGNLAALRELALLWVADRVDEDLADYRARHGISQPWETRERVLVAITGAPGSDRLIRRASRIAARSSADLVGVHVRPTDGASSNGARDERLQYGANLLRSLGGRYIETHASSVAEALVNVARAENATQLVVGATGRSRWTELLWGSVIHDLLRRAGAIDVHVIRRDEPDTRPATLPSVPSSHRFMRLPAPRRRSGWALALLATPAVALAMTTVRGQLGVAGGLLIMLGMIVATAAVGGLRPALTGALVGFAAIDWYLVPPIHHWRISRASDVVALVMFVAIAAAVSVLVDRLARRGAEARRADAEAEALAALAGRNVTADAGSLDHLLDDLRAALDLEGAAVARRDPLDVLDIESSSGVIETQAPQRVLELDLGDDAVLLLAGDLPGDQDQRLLHAFASQIQSARLSARLQLAADRATELAATDDLRSAILAAVSHDLRTPLASIKAAATSLLADDIQWDATAVKGFSQGIDEDADRLNLLINNLLDMSRLQAGVVALDLQPVGLQEAVRGAISALTRPGPTPEEQIDETTNVSADPVLLERVLVNVLDNALLHGCPTRPAQVQANQVGDDVTIRIMDQGPGIPVTRRVEAMQPFQRLGDNTASTTGLGLGLALARGFMKAMGGELGIDDTPGGGTTLVLELKACRGRPETIADHAPARVGPPPPVEPSLLDRTSAVGPPHPR